MGEVVTGRPFADARDRGARIRRAAIAAAAIACLCSSHALLVAARYPLRDQDSRLYEGISVELARQPLSTWIAPVMPAGHHRQPFLEHTAVLFWPAALLERMGVPRGALLANLVYHLACIALLYEVARTLAGGKAAAIAAASYLVSPLGVMYLVRANHEPLWGVLFLAGLRCAIELPRRPALGPPLAVSIALAALVKGALGLLVVPVLAACALRRERSRMVLAWIGAGLLLSACAAAGYELLYRAATDESFLRGYLASQLQAVRRDEALGIARKLTNPLYYAGNALWFGLPGAALWAAALWKGTPRATAGLAARGFAMGLGCISLMSRRAMRYLFPAYPLLHLAGAEWLASRPRVASWLDRFEPLVPFAIAGAVPLLCAARVFFDARWFRFVNPLGD